MKAENKKKRIYTNLAMIMISMLIGVGNYLISFKNAHEIMTIKQPALLPPAWAIPVILVIIYFLLGKAAAKVCLSNSEEKSDALFIYVVQHVVCFFSSAFIFLFREFFLGLCWFIFLFLLSVLMTTRFKRCDQNSGKLLMPYLITLLYSIVMICSAWLLNK